MTEDKKPVPFASGAPEKIEDDAHEIQAGDTEMDEIFEAWSAWCRTRRFYAPPSNMGSILGQLRGPSRPSRPPPSAKCSTSLSALHLAIKGQPEDALDSKVFWLYYGHRVSSIKGVADALGISRVHFYRLKKAFCKRVIIAAKQIESDNIAAGEALPHRAQHTGE